MLFRSAKSGMLPYLRELFRQQGNASASAQAPRVEGIQVGTVIRRDGEITGIRESRHKTARTHTIEILDFGENNLEYLELLYDRIPTLPQSLHRDFGVIRHLWQNIAHRVARSRQL